MHGPSPTEQAGEGPGGAGDRARPADGGVEISGPDIEMSGGGGSASEPAGTRSGAAEFDRTLDDSDPFVDDAALISWMGFNARTGRGRPSSIAVADEILDPPRPPAEPARPADAARPGDAVTPADAVTPPDTAGPVARTGSIVAPADRPPIRKAAAFTVSGSFWSFGRRRVPAARPGKGPTDER
jgi:hypothetical protein